MSTVSMDNVRKYSIAAPSAIMAMLLLVACDGSFVGPDETPVEGELAQVRTSPSIHTFTGAGQTLQLTTAGLDASGDTVGDVSFEWSSTDTSIATVNSMGLVTARTAGTASIIVAAVAYAVADTVAIAVQEPSQGQAPSSALHPNEPAGMTIITNADGSVAYNEPGGPAFGDPKWGNWWGNRGGEQNVEVVDDPANPTGSGKAVRLHWVGGPGNATGEAAKAVIDFGAGYRTLYIAFRVVKPQHWPTGDAWLGTDKERLARFPNGNSHKWFYILPENSSDQSWGHGSWTRVGLEDQLCISTSYVCSARGALSLREPNETLMEFLYVASTDDQTSDAQVTIWVNGELAGHADDYWMSSKDGVTYDPFYRKLQLYAHANDVPDVPHHYDIRELYISGK